MREGVFSSVSARWLPTLAGVLSLLATACAHEHAPRADAEPADAAAAADPFFEDEFTKQNDFDPLEPVNRRANSPRLTPLPSQ